MTRARDLADGKFATDVEVENSTAGAQNMVVIHHASNTSGDESKIQFKRTTDAGSDREVAAIVADRIGGNDTDLAFETNTDGADGAVEKMRLNHLGVLSVDQVFGLSDTDTGVALGANGANIMQFYTGNSERGRFDASGNLKVEDGDLVIGTSGHGIDFSATSDTSGGGSELLDDYEEGTWTGTLEGSTTNPSTTIAISSFRYTKIGRLVFVQGQFSNVDTTGASGAPRVTGLPFTAATSYATGNVMFYNRFTIGTTSANVSPYVASNTMYFYQSTNQSSWAEVAHSAGAAAYLAFTAVYEV